MCVHVCIRMIMYCAEYAGNQDYSGISGQQITFDFDSTGFNIPVPIINDVNIEPTEQFIATVTTSASGVVLQPSQAVINILDDDGALHNIFKLADMMVNVDI